MAIKQKLTLYFPPELLEEAKLEARRQERTVSWILQKAWDKQPHPEIAAHLGEVLWVQGERDAARAIWREGVRLDAKDKTLRRVMQRFGVEP